LAPSSAQSPPKIFGSWSLDCPADRPRCFLSQIVAVDPEGRQVVLGASVELGPPGAPPMIHFRLTRHVEINPGLGVKVDDAPELRLAISTCAQQACEAAGRLTPFVESLFSTGRVAQIAFIGPEARQVVVPLRLAEFTAAMAALRRAGEAP